MGRASRLKAVTAQTEPTPENRGDVVGQVDAVDLAEYREVFERLQAANQAAVKAEQTLIQARQVATQALGAERHVADRIAKKYGIQAGDNTDLETGTITRKQANG